MTTVAVVADVHVANHKRLGGPAEIGLNERCRLAIDSLRLACWEARERGCARLYVAGDLFDTVAPSPRVLAAVQDVLAESSHRGCPVTVMPGNHDAISAEPGDHALGPLRYVSTVVDRPSVDRLGDMDVILIPHRSGRAATWLRSAIAEAEDEDSEGDRADPSQASLRSLRVLVLHLGISTSSSPSYLRDDPSSIDASGLGAIADESDVDIVVAGHWHDMATFSLGDARAIQIGALAPAGWGDLGVADRGRMLVVDSGGRVESVEIPGPRFVKVRSADDVEAFAERAQGSKLFVEWLAAADEMADARDDLKILIDRGVVHRGAVTIDVEDASEAAREAAAAARSSDSLAAALAAYVGKMKLPKGVDRGRVLELARRFTGIG